MSNYYAFQNNYGAQTANESDQLGVLGTVHDGDCPTGVDYNADQYATEYGFKHETYPADWDTYGKSAGPRRNEQMAQAGADICLAFPSAGKSAGTWDMIQRAANHGIKTIIIPEETK